jgi:glycosyltransferase involved in cell wall biosynthesis
VLLATSEVAAYHAFAPDARLVRIANAIQLHHADLRATRYAGTRPLEIAYVGRLAVNKGILDVIEAVRILRDKAIEVRLTIAGSGAARQEIVQAVASGGLGDRVRVVGAVFGEAKQGLWQQSDVFALPTYHHEGLPYALLEAMAGGAVPVAAPVGAIPDVMQDGVHGLFVPPRNPLALAAALERLAGDRTFLHALAAAGRARIMSQYSVGRLAEEFRTLYESLAQQAPRAT